MKKRDTAGQAHDQLDQPDQAEEPEAEADGRILITDSSLACAFPALATDVAAELHNSVKALMDVKEEEASGPMCRYDDTSAGASTTSAVTSGVPLPAPPAKRNLEANALQ